MELSACARFNLDKLNWRVNKKKKTEVPLQRGFLVWAPVSSVRAILSHVPCTQEIEVKTTQISKAKQFNSRIPQGDKVC